MNIKDELEKNDIDYNELTKKLGYDSCKKVGAILNILEIGHTSIAHSKLILTNCYDMIDKCSVTFGTKTDD